MKNFLVVNLRRQIAPAELRRQQPEPVAWTECGVNEIALDVVPQEDALEVIERHLPGERIRRGGEAAAGDRGDHIDFIEDLRPRQLLKHSVGECRGARAAAGERQDDERLILVGCRSEFREAIAVRLVEPLQWSVRLVSRARREKDEYRSGDPATHLSRTR